MEKAKKARKKEDAGKSPEMESASCNDSKCPFHGTLSARGRIFEGKVIKKFPNRAVIEFERVVYAKKYERYLKARTRIHARIPGCLSSSVKTGDHIQVRECRPLSKIIKFVMIKKTLLHSSGFLDDQKYRNISDMNKISKENNAGDKK